MDEIVGSKVVFDSVERRRSTRVRASPRSQSDNIERSSHGTQSASSCRATPAKSTRSTPQYQIDNQNIEPDPSPIRRKGLRIRVAPINHDVNYHEEVSKPLTDEERRAWKGWVELESDPALFNCILREYGVKDVKVHEILGLDDDFFGFVPKPIYGLIFLYKYFDDEEEEESPKCPNRVWFANQTITNACATVALLNIVMNHKDIELGEALSAFKADTSRLKPPYRGKRLGEHDFIRNIHNSFATRMDFLNADLALLNDMEKWKRTRNSKRKAPARKSKKASYNDDTGFHFIAYVPIDGEVWRLDGLQRQPVKLGKAEGDWTGLARDNILQRVSQRDDISFNLLALCKGPLLSIPHELASNIRAIMAVEAALSTHLPDWKVFLNDKPDLENGPNATYGLTDAIFDSSTIPASALDAISSAGENGIVLLELYKQWAMEQRQLRGAFMEELRLVVFENEQAARRKHDYTPAIYDTIKDLAERGVLQGLVEEVKANGG